MDRFQEMQAFVAVVDAGSFVGASGPLSISKAAVSRHVADLEKRLGARLLHRTTRRLSLTEEGRAFYERSREALALVEEAETQVGMRSSDISGRIKISAPHTFGVRHLAALWGPFMEANPGISLELVLSDRVVDLVEDSFDLAIRIADLPDSTLVSRSLASTQMVLCASPAYLARAGKPAHPTELVRHQVISYSYSATGNEWSFTGPDGPLRVKVKARLYANNGDTCRVAALGGQGIILQPDFLVGPDIREGRLIELMPEYRTGELGVYAVYPSRKLVPLRVRRLIDHLAQCLRGSEWSG